MAQAVSDPAPAAALKVAEMLAGRIVDEIAALGWPVGRVLGTEPQLAEQYGVSRNVLRETIRLLEHLNVAHTRGKSRRWISGHPTAVGPRFQGSRYLSSLRRRRRSRVVPGEGAAGIIDR